MSFAKWAAAGVVGFGVGAATTFVILSPQLVNSPPPRGLAHKLVKYGLPEGDGVVQIEDSFATCFDSRTRNPKWVLERLTKGIVEGTGNREYSHFYEDQNVDPLFRPTLLDYRGSGYDRGHLAPAASHKYSQDELQKTFSLSNISPQVGPGFNRGYWARFEKFVKDLCKRADEVFVVTGPLWLPIQDGRYWQANHRLIGKPPSLVAVPTHFYKVILAENKVAAFVMPNAPIDPQTPLKSFLVPLEDLQRVAGLRFFPKKLAADSEDYSAYIAEEQRFFLSRRRDQGPLLLPGTNTSARDNPRAISDSGPRYGSSTFVPLCDKFECQLPSENFWEKKKGRPDKDEKTQRISDAKIEVQEVLPVTSEAAKPK